MSKNILCDRDGNSGPVYGKHMITAGKDGSFKIWSEDKQTSVVVNLDGDKEQYLPLASVSLDVSEFHNAPTNKYGLKELAKYEDEILTLTANGLLIIYSGGLPSLQGLPSDIIPVSSMWIGEDGLLRGYPFSLHSESELLDLLKYLEDFSFYKRNYNSAPMMYKITCTDVSSSDQKIINDCNYFMDSFRASRYIHLYPGFTEKAINTYNSLVKRNQFELGFSYELKETVLNSTFGGHFSSSRVSNEYTYSK